MDMFGKSWRGEASLSTAFWIVYVVAGAILWLIVNFIVNSAAPGAVFIFKQSLCLLFLFPYTLFSTICVWRCGKNSHIIWSILSKIVVILALIYSVLAIVTLFVTKK